MDRSWGLRTGFVAALACSGFAGTAIASVEPKVATGPPIAGPVLAGNQVLWATGRADAGFDLQQASVAGGASSVSARFHPPAPSDSLEPALAASASRAVVSFAVGDHSTAWLNRTVLTRSTGGQFETLDSACPLFGTPDRPRSIDVSDEVVAFARCKGDGSEEIVVRDYSVGRPVDQVIPGAQPHGLRLAGRYVAWLEQGTGQPYDRSGIAVFDRLLGTLAYRIPASAMPGEVHDLDLQTDGKVAFSYAGVNPIAWASVAEPTAHPLALPNRAAYEVRIAGDRIGFEVGRQAGAGNLSLADVGVTDLAGHWRRVGNLGEGSFFTDDFDFDGTRLAWWSFGCTRALLHVASADGPAVVSRARSGCRLRFTRRARRSGKHLRLFVDCFGFASGECEARSVKLTARRKGHTIVVGRGHTARVTLTKVGLDLVRHRRRLSVVAFAVLHDGVGRHERRFGRLNL